MEGFVAWSTAATPAQVSFARVPPECSFLPICSLAESMCSRHDRRSKQAFREHHCDTCSEKIFARCLSSSTMTFRSLCWNQLLVCRSGPFEAGRSGRVLLTSADNEANMENYLHRIGRSGRFGRKGVAINFVTNNDVRTMTLASRQEMPIQEHPGARNDMITEMYSF